MLATFMENGRLKQVPARWKKRRVVLRWLADHFRPAERYPEALVNDILRRYHDDFALLRRLLVDEELMHRKAGVYWRAGTLPTGGWWRPGFPGTTTSRGDSPLSMDWPVNWRD